MKDAPPNDVPNTFNLLRERIEEYTPPSFVHVVEKMIDEYAVPTWTVLYKIKEWSSFKKPLHHNSFNEIQNKLMQGFTGIHNNYWPCIYGLKEYSAIHMARWRQFKQNGFQRKKSLREHMKTAALKRMWNFIVTNDTDEYKDKDEKMWAYLGGVSCAYNANWKKFDKVSIIEVSF
eukprot:164664_1